MPTLTKPSLAAQDSLDRCVLERAEHRRVAQRRVELLGAEALAQEQDPSRLRGPHAWRSAAHEAEELGRALAICSYATRS
jgi:hypothetical protein